MSRYRTRSSGFTLIEVLVALLILSVGLLGLAGLQGSALRNTQSALFRSQAVMLVNDMANRMRQNQTGVDDNQYSNIALPVAGVIPDCIGSTCTSTEIATAGAAAWGSLIISELPSGDGSVVCIDGDAGDADACTDGSMHTITVQWDDNKSGDITADDPSVVINVRP